MRYLRRYHPLLRGSNPAFNKNDQLIIDFKNGSKGALREFSRRVSARLASGLVIACVPGSQAHGKTPLHGLVKRVAKSTAGFPAPKLLVRTASVTPSRLGGRRTVDRHLKTIKVWQASVVKELMGPRPRVLLIDDVSTSGASIEACTQLLKKEGFRVRALVLGLTKRDPGVSA